MDPHQVPSKVRRERKPPPNEAQRHQQLDALCRALDTICDSWDDALAAERSWGYPRQSPGPKAAAGIVRQDPLDPLHTRSQPAATTTASAFGDQTGNTAVQADPAGRWLRDTRRCLALLLRMTSADERIDNTPRFGTERHPRFNGPFYPPYLRQSLRRAASDVVSLWPTNCALLFERIHNLANVARAEWPPTPKLNEVIDGVTVGSARDRTGATCEGCGLYASGDASDPVGRINGKPYHRKPGPGHGACYFAANRDRAGARPA